MEPIRKKILRVSIISVLLLVGFDLLINNHGIFPLIGVGYITLGSFFTYLCLKNNNVRN